MSDDDSASVLTLHPRAANKTRTRREDLARRKGEGGRLAHGINVSGRASRKEDRISFTGQQPIRR